MSRPQKYTDVPAGFQVYSDVPAGFSVVESSATTPAPRPTPPPNLNDRLAAGHKAIIDSATFLPRMAIRAGQAYMDVGKSAVEFMRSDPGSPSTGPGWQDRRAKDIVDTIKSPITAASQQWNDPRYGGAIERAGASASALMGGDPQAAREHFERREIPEGIAAAIAVPAVGIAINRGRSPRPLGKLKLVDQPQWVQDVANSYGAKRTRRFEKEAHRNVAEAMSEMKESEQTFLRGAVKNLREAEAVGRDAMNRIYTRHIQPFIQGLTDAGDLKPLANKLKSEIPEGFTEKQRARIEAEIDAELDRTVSSSDVVETIRQRKRAEERMKLDAGNFDKAAYEKTFKGWVKNHVYDGLREWLGEKTKGTFGVDVRDALRRYGAVSDIVQEWEKMPGKRGIMERLEGSFTSGTAPNIRGRAFQMASGVFKTPDYLVSRGFANYKPYPNTQPLPTIGMRRSGGAGGQMDLLPADQSTPLFQPPAERIPSLGERQAQYQRGMETWKAAKPELPKGQLSLEKGIPPQLFGLEQTPYRWRPTMRETSTLKDLVEMRAEIIGYLKDAKPTPSIRHEWAKDVLAIEQEINRRKKAQAAGGENK